MVNVVQRIIGQVLGATMGGPGGGGAGNGQTIADFLETISDYSYTSGQDIITDLLMCLARSLTFSDLIGFLTGSNAVVSKLREPLKEFLRTRLGVTGPDDISSAMRRVLDETHPGLEAAVAAANVRQGVDYPETLDNFFMQRLTPLVEQVWTSDEETFGLTFYDSVQTFLADLTNLSVSCFSDGQASLERLMRNQLSNVTDDVGSGAIGSWTVSTALGHLRNYVAGIGESSSIETYIIQAPNDRRAERARRTSAAAAVATTTEASAADTEEDEEPFETPRSSPEAMDVVATDDDEAAAVAVVPAVVAAAPSAPEEEGGTTFPRELQLRSGSGPDMVVGREPWHRSVPPEWVPIITRDQGLHPAGSATQAPFSDAYLTTVPAKKRRLAAGRKPADGSTVQDNIQRTLADAVKVTGVKPSTSMQDVVGSAAANARLEEGLAENVRTSIKRRLEQDKDFKAEKYPNCKDFLDENK